MLRNIIIFLVVFLFVMWFQHNDDLKFNNSKKRITLYDFIKIPLFVSCIVLLLKDLNYNDYFNQLQSIFTISPTDNVSPIYDHKYGLNDVFTDQPDF